MKLDYLMPSGVLKSRGITVMVTKSLTRRALIKLT
jgi:hypothetical protein